MSKAYDFDQFWAEKEEESIQIKVFGEVHDVKGDVPASLMVKMIRLMKAEGAEAELDEDDIFSALYAYVGKETVQGWIKKGIGMKQLEDITGYITKQIRGQKGNPEGAKVPPEKKTKK